MAFVGDDEVEKVSRILRVNRLLLARHKGLEDGKEQAGIFGNLPLVLANGLRVDAGDSIGGKGRKRIVSLISENVAVCQKQNTGAAGWLPTYVPFGLKQLPCDLEGNGGELDTQLATIINERQFLPRNKTVKATGKRVAA